MPWIYITLAIICSTFSKILTRKVVGDVSLYSFSLFNEIVSTLVFLPFIFSVDFNLVTNHDSYVYYGVAISCFLWTFLALLGNKTIKMTDVSLREPLSQFRTLFGFVIGIFFLSESTTLLQYIGVLIIFISSVITMYHPGKKHHGFSDEGALLVICSSFIFAITSAFDKINSQSFPPVFYAFLVYAIPMVLLLTQLPWRYKELKSFSRKTMSLGFFSSTLQALGFFMTLQAFSTLPFTTVYPLLQLTTVLAPVAAIFFLNERTYLARRIVGAVVSIIGGLFIRLGH